MSGDWKPSARLSTLRARARMLSDIRAFFAAREVLEVETPALANAGVSDPHLQNLTTATRLPGDRFPRTLYLQTSPEYAMKRLLAAGSGAIYQICKVYRDGEFGPLHNPEFTLLEWYRPGFDYQDIMRETTALLAAVIGSPVPVEYSTYADAFKRYACIDPLRTSLAELIECARAHIALPADVHRLIRDDWLDLLLSHVIAPQLGIEVPLLLTHFPASQAALARVVDSDPPVAERFEVFIGGIEVANGFHELTDGAEQRRRFELDNERRLAGGLPVTPLDERLLAALSSGLPPCAGVAVGIDRLLMVVLKLQRIQDAIVFDSERA